MIDFYVKTGIRLSLRDKRLFEITEVEVMRVDCIDRPMMALTISRKLIRQSIRASENFIQGFWNYNQTETNLLQIQTSTLL